MPLFRNPRMLLKTNELYLQPHNVVEKKGSYLKSSDKLGVAGDE